MVKKVKFDCDSSEKHNYLSKLYSVVIESKEKISFQKKKLIHLIVHAL